MFRVFFRPVCISVDVLDGAIPEEEVDVLAVRDGPHEVGRVQLTEVVLLRAQQLPVIKIIVTCRIYTIYLIMYVPLSSCDKV